MADKFTKRSQSAQGECGYVQWMERHFFKHNVTSGPMIDGFGIDGTPQKIPLNRAAIMMKGCKILRHGTVANYGKGGSNNITGKPVCFVDFGEHYLECFKEKNGKFLLRKDHSFLLPLFQLDEHPELLKAMKEGYASFIAQKYGNNQLDITHVANGICCGLAAILFALSNELTIDGNKPDTTQLKFLVEAQYWLSYTARSVATFSPECDGIFRLIPHVAKTADTFQSTQMAIIFNEIPRNEVLASQFGESLKKYQRYSKDGTETSFLTVQPVGLIGLILIGPVLGSMICSEDDNVKIINDVVSRLNIAIEEIMSSLEMHSSSDIHSQNKAILSSFVKAASPETHIKLEWIGPIYDAVLAGETNYHTFLDVGDDNVDFVESEENITLNGKKSVNLPILTEKDEHSATWISTDPREWSGIKLKPKCVYAIVVKPLGNATFQSGNTNGQYCVANFRFTSGEELMKGSYSGISSAGMFYDACTRKYTRSPHKINPTERILIVSDSYGINVTQNQMKLLSIANDSSNEMSPLLCFKNCSIHVTLVEKLTRQVEEKPQAAEEPQATKFIDGLTLVDALKNMRVGDDKHLKKNGKFSWG